MPDEKSKQIQELLTQLAGAQVMSELVAKVVAKVTSTRWRSWQTPSCARRRSRSSRATSSSTSSSGSDGLHADRDLEGDQVAEQEATIADVVRDQVKNKLASFARTVADKWFEPLVLDARHRFEKLLNSI